MADLGVDFSFARFTAAQLKAAGFSFAARYLASSNGKRLTAGEVSDFRANGIDIVLVWEDETTAALEGFNRGQHDAQLALQQANNLGIPGDIPIYLAVDFDINDAQKPAAGEYFKGAESVGPRFRAGYGGYYLIKYLFDNGLIDFGWQAVAWSGGKLDPRAQIYQNGNSAFGGQADIDEARQTNFGQWSTQGGNMPASQDKVDNTTVALAFNVGLNRNASDQEVADIVNSGITVEQLLRNIWASPEHVALLQSSVPPLPSPDPLPVPDNNPPSPAPKPVATKSLWQKISAFWHSLVG